MGPTDDLAVMKAMFDSSPDFAMFSLDRNGFVTSWNRGAELITGFTCTEMLGREASRIFTPEDRQRGVQQKEMDTALREGRASDYRWHLRKNGQRFWADGSMTRIPWESSEPIGFLKIMRDVTERKHAEAVMHRLANIDMLTNLANRAAFTSRLRDLVDTSLRTDELLLLHLVDLDHFKQVNDSLGHQAGDTLLRMAAERMCNVTRETDFVARIGGDEFVVLEPNARTPDAGATLAGKLLQTLSRPFQITDHQVSIGASIGIAICPNDASAPDDLLHRADLALYRVKQRRNDYSFFTPHLDALTHQRNRDVAALRQAVENGEFSVAYQPKVDCRSGRLLALEALLRCSNASLAGYPIEYLIRLAKETGLMPRIGMWVLREACRQKRRWRNAGLLDQPVCVNICSQEITDPGMPATVNEVLRESGLQPCDLQLEITEHELVSSTDQGLSILKELHGNGIRLSLDDFGTGYSALNYLSNLPVSMLKLDQSFLRKVPQDPQTCTLVQAIIDLAHALKINVTAEGVETAEQVAFFQDKQCDALQGFFFSKPLQADAITDWLTGKAAAPSKGIRIA